MARPITIVAFLMVVSIIGAGVYLVARPRHHVEEVAVEVVQEEPMPIPAPAPRLAPVRLPVQEKVPILVATASAPPSRSEDSGSSASGDVLAVFRRRAQIIAAHKKQLIDEADEKAFEVVKASEATRMAIRRINEEYARRLQAIPAPSAIGQAVAQGSGSAPDSYDAARAARQAAIAEALGPDAARDFENAERTAEVSVRAHLRRQWGRELRANAGSPPTPEAQ
jgi:hypothetical protein